MLSKYAPLSRFTCRLTPDVAAAFDEIALHARRSLGHRIEKSELLRVMIMRVFIDVDLRNQVIDEVKARRQAEPEAVA